MKKLIIGSLLLFCLLAVNDVEASFVTIFEDNFDAGFDSTKWSKVETNGGTATVAGGVLDCYLPNTAHSSAKLLSSSIDVSPYDILNLTVSGKFKTTSMPTAGITMTMRDATDSTKYVHTEHGYWINGNSADFDLYLVDSKVAGSATTLGATFPSTYRDFSFYFTDSTWTYSENGSPIKTFSSTTMQNASDLFTLQFGLYDVSANYQHVYFDDIKMVAEVNDTKVPEPASMALLGLGVLGFGIVRKKRKNRVDLLT